MPGLSLVTRGMWVMRVQMWRYYGLGRSGDDGGMMPTVTGRVAARHDAGGVRSIGFRLGMVWRVGGWVGQQLQASEGKLVFFFFPGSCPQAAPGLRFYFLDIRSKPHSIKLKCIFYSVFYMLVLFAVHPFCLGRG